MLVCHGRSVLRGSPHEDVEHVVGSSGAPQDREREPRSSFAAAALSLEAAASRASSEGVASPKTVVKDERMAIIKSTSGHITRAFISGEFSRVDGL